VKLQMLNQLLVINTVAAVDHASTFLLVCSSLNVQMLNQLKLLVVHTAAADDDGNQAATPAAGSKRSRSTAAAAAGTSSSTLRFSAVLQSTAVAKIPGSSSRANRSAAAAAPDAAGACSRIDASRAFYEMLVLQNRGYVGLQQQGPYGELLVSPKAKLLEEAQQQQ
jgi:hypothetical protein